MQNLGIFGGSFDPVHIMHIETAKIFCNNLNLKKCFFVPTHISPFKDKTNEPPRASDTDRINMLKLALAEDMRFELERYEIEKKEISYTINTVKHIKSIYPKASLYLLVGSDQAVEFHRWKDWKEILNIANICIAARQASIPESVKENILKYLTLNNKKPYLFISSNGEISSTEIRRRIKSGEPIEELVSIEVAEYIHKKKLYL